MTERAGFNDRPAPMKVLIAESREFAPEGLARLRRHAEVITADLDREGILAAVRDADVLWVRLRNRIDSEVMEAAPRLRVIVTNTTGLGHIDFDEADRRRIRVLSLRGDAEFLKQVRATAELTIGLLLALTRHVPAAAAHVQSGGWNREALQGP